jgi:Tol biopolymer transport system component
MGVQGFHSGRRPAHAGSCATLVAALLAFAPAASATFPGSNGEIAFDPAGSQPVGTYAIQGDGRGLRRITPAGVKAPLAKWSPDGARLVYAHPESSTGHGIWVVNADGTGDRQITRESRAVAGSDTYPAWSPDGGRIAFVRNSDLHVMNADGSGVRNLTPALADQVTEPDWSPRGGEIAFTANSGLGDAQVVTLGGVVRQLPGLPGNVTSPSWSPDGSRIAYEAGSAVGVVNADGTGVRPLISHPDDTGLAGAKSAAMREVWHVSWSPDGTQIAFVNDPPTGFGDPVLQEELWRINANDGSGLLRLGAGSTTFMDWGPARAELGKAVSVAVVRGTVLIGLPGKTARAAQKGQSFVPLQGLRTIPVGSLLDTRRGTVRLTSALDSKGAQLQSGNFSAGVFKVLQSRGRRGLTDLKLTGSSFKGCGARGSTAGIARFSRRKVRRLRSNAKGRFRTHGRYSSATVRGTKWDTVDRCDGTLTRVTRGRVVVRDFRRKRSITVRAGRSYFARR